MSLDVLAERAVQERLAMERGRRQICNVCGDRASGRHYGVLTCDGCRGFFKRSVRRDPGYSCKYQGTCIVDLKRRNQCQACRFQRCINVGMNRHAVQHERLPKKKLLRQTTKCFLEESNHFNGNSNMSENMKPKCDDTDHYLLAVTQAIGGNNEEIPKENLPPSFPQRPMYSIDSLLEVANKERSMTNSIKLLTPPLTPPQSPLVPTLYREKIKNSLEKILQGCLIWTHSMPIFRELPSSDKSLLLEEGWIELFLLSVIEVEYSETLLISYLRETVNPKIAREEAASIDRLGMALQRLRSLVIDPVEMAYLKAVAIFKPYVQGLAMKQYVENMQDQAQVMLGDYIRSRHPGNNVRFGKLILTLTLLRSLGLPTLEDCFHSNLSLSNSTFSSTHSG